jgi:SAM-dependent methyltransferase
MPSQSATPTPYDPKEHWTKRGESYREELRSRRRGKTARNFDAQERLLPEVITALKPESVLEVGCGYGRMTALISRLPSVKVYDAVDFSLHNIEDARMSLKNVRFTAGDFMDIHFDRRYDLVFACEVLMHVPPAQIGNFLRKMRDLSQAYVVSLDYSMEKSVELDPTNFNHGYRALYEGLSPKTVEEKRLETKRLFGVEAYPQSIFVADFRTA